MKPQSHQNVIPATKQLFYKSIRTLLFLAKWPQGISSIWKIAMLFYSCSNGIPSIIISVTTNKIQLLENIFQNNSNTSQPKGISAD